MSSKSLQYIATYDQKATAGEGSIVASAGSTITNVRPQDVLAPVLGFLSDFQTARAAHDIRALELAAQERTAAQQGAQLIATTAQTGLLQKAERIDDAPAALAQRLAPYVLGAVAVGALALVAVTIGRSL